MRAVQGRASRPAAPAAAAPRGAQRGVAPRRAAPRRAAPRRPRGAPSTLPHATAPPASDTVIADADAEIGGLLGGQPFDWKAGWYPVAELASLPTDRPTHFSLLGADLALWHDGTTWRAFEDRCPHRAVPLSEGRVEAPPPKRGGEKGTPARELLCSYHGFRFAGDGACVAVPQALTPDAEARACAAPKACATPYPTLADTGDGLLWVWATPNDFERAAATPNGAHADTEKPDEQVGSGGGGGGRGSTARASTSPRLARCGSRRGTCATCRWTQTRCWRWVGGRCGRDGVCLAAANSPTPPPVSFRTSSTPPTSPFPTTASSGRATLRHGRRCGRRGARWAGRTRRATRSTTRRPRAALACAPRSTAGRGRRTRVSRCRPGRRMSPKRQPWCGNRLSTRGTISGATNPTCSSTRRRPVPASAGSSLRCTSRRKTRRGR